ncbi:MAG: restriction endonuclease [Pseudomonadota bacterium]
MAKESLFSILTRQPWWVALLVAFVLFWIVYAIFPPVAPFMALPFVLMAAYIAFKQWRMGSPFDAAETLTTLRAMSWDEFSALIAQAYQREGYAVAATHRADYDFTLTRTGRVTLVQCRRWKVSVVGAGPLRELARAVEREGAASGICISAGSFSAPALAVPRTEPVSLIDGDALAKLVQQDTRNRKTSSQ